MAVTNHQYAGLAETVMVWRSVMLTETVAGRTYDYSHNVGRGAQSGIGVFQPGGPGSGCRRRRGCSVANRGSESISNVSWDRTGVGQRISKVSLGSQSGEEEYLAEFSRYGSAPGQLIWPAGLVVDAQGHVYVTDEWLNRVSVFDSEGNFLSAWNTVQNGDSEPNGASGIAIDANSTLFVTDGRSRKVREFATEWDVSGQLGPPGQWRWRTGFPLGHHRGRRGLRLRRRSQERSGAEIHQRW